MSRTWHQPKKKVLPAVVAFGVALLLAVPATPAFALTANETTLVEQTQASTELRRDIPLGHVKAAASEVSTDGSTAVVSIEKAPRIMVVDLKSDAVTEVDFGADYSKVLQMALSADGARAVVALESAKSVWDNFIATVDTASGKVLYMYKEIDYMSVTTISADGNTIYVARPGDEITARDALSDTYIATAEYGTTNPSSIRPSKDGSVLYMGTTGQGLYGTTMHILNATDLSVIASVPAPDISSFSHLSQNGDYLYSAGYNRYYVFELSAETGDLLSMTPADERLAAVAGNHERYRAYAVSKALSHVMSIDFVDQAGTTEFVRDLPGTGIDMDQDPSGNLVVLSTNEETGAFLSTIYEPKVSTPVASQGAVIGKSVTVSAKASHLGTDEASGLQWQQSSDGKTWTNIPGATESSYTFKLTDKLSKNKFRVAYTDAFWGINDVTAATSFKAKDAEKPGTPKPPTTNPNPPTECAKPSKTAVFADTPVAHKFYKEIDWMACMKYSTGWKQATGKPLYKPADNLERQAMAAFIYRMEAPKNYKAPKVSPFADVKTTDKFYKEIAWMWTAKLSTGYKEASGKPTYRPHDSLTREAMAAFIYRLEAPKNYVAPKVSPMADMKPGMKFYKEISWMYSEKLSTGNKVGATKEYWPKDDLSRQAMAAFIYRLVNDYRK